MKNTLIQYKGGGYDGCFWEWNFCYYDSKGKWHDIFSSGRQGIKSEKEMSKLKDQYSDPYYYNLLKDKDIQEFITENAEHNARGVLEYLERNSEYKILLPCEICENKVLPSQIMHTSYKGNGGIGVVYTGMICEDCYYANTCGYCGEFYYPDDEAHPFNQPEETQINYSLCKYCIENKGVI